MLTQISEKNLNVKYVTQNSEGKCVNSKLKM